MKPEIEAGSDNNQKNQDCDNSFFHGIVDAKSNNN
jgi:hypothetical protein